MRVCGCGGSRWPRAAGAAACFRATAKAGAGAAAKTIAGAGLDVFDSEPHAPDALTAFPNVVLTPHIGWLTSGTFARSFSIAAENCRRLAAGEALLHQVA